VTIPTALAIAEIATNRRVEGGGEYFIVSRSFGTTIGGVIGLSLYLSQAISVAFYMLAFAEAFTPLAPWFNETFNRGFDTRFVSLPAAAILLTAVMVQRGGRRCQAALCRRRRTCRIVVAFFMGKPVDGFEAQGASLTGRLANGDSFFVVFAICFPAFTGMTAGVGLSGDLRNPRRAIPAGTLAATATGMAVYQALVIKLAWSAPIDDLASDQLIMSRIAAWGPLILIGLGAATLSSALGSVLVAPRTLQALGADRNVLCARPTAGWRAARATLTSRAMQPL
jgi:solute carrier family 12 sodium/potassium/chloride transporter 2